MQKLFLCRIYFVLYDYMAIRDDDIYFNKTKCQNSLSYETNTFRNILCMSHRLYMSNRLRIKV